MHLSIVELCQRRQAGFTCSGLQRLLRIGGGASGVDSLPVISSRHLHADLPEHTVPVGRPATGGTCLARYLCDVVGLPPVLLIIDIARQRSHLNPVYHSGDVIVTGKT